MKIKEGDIVEIIAIDWDEPHWEFGHPCVIVSPIIRYSPNGESPEKMIEDLVIDLICEEDVESKDISREFEWRGWKLNTLKKVCRDRLAGKETWKTKIRSVVKQKILFTHNGSEFDFEILETIEA